jgi:hypothetical protein
MELKPVEFEEFAEEMAWRHAEAPLHVRLKHQDLCLVWSWNQSLVVCPPLGLGPWSH